MTYTISYLLFERSPVILVVLGAVAWWWLTQRAVGLLLPVLRERRETRRYERESRMAERAAVTDLPTRSADRRAA